MWCYNCSNQFYMSHNWFWTCVRSFISPLNRSGGVYCTTQSMSSSKNSGHSETHTLHSIKQIHPSTSHVNRFRLPSKLFSDPVDEDSSDTESFDADDMYGSDSDTEIIGKMSPLSDPQPSDAPSSVDDTLVWSLHLMQHHRCSHIS